MMQKQNGNEELQAGSMPPFQFDHHHSTPKPCSNSSDGLSFPWRLHGVLEAADREGFEHIISWLPEGTSFKVHNPKAFQSEVLPRYLSSMTKYKSFVRQLNLYCFVRVRQRGPEQGSYSHPMFVRANKDLCNDMQLTKLKGKRFDQRVSPLSSTGNSNISQTKTTKKVAQRKVQVGSLVSPLRRKDDDDDEAIESLLSSALSSSGSLLTISSVDVPQRFDPDLSQFADQERHTVSSYNFDAHAASRSDEAAMAEDILDQGHNQSDHGNNLSVQDIRACWANDVALPVVDDTTGITTTRRRRSLDEVTIMVEPTPIFGPVGNNTSLQEYSCWHGKGFVEHVVLASGKQVFVVDTNRNLSIV